MIITKLKGGLGNQMFQYAAGRALAAYYQTLLCIDDSFYKNKRIFETNRFYELDSFDIYANSSLLPLDTYSKALKFHLPNLLIMRINSLIKGGMNKRKIYLHKKVREKFFHFDEDFNNYGEYVVLDGYWQSEKYFKNFRNAILQEFSLRQELKDFPIELTNLIAQDNTVSLHFRFGDYLRDNKTKKIHGVLDISYYKRAIELIRKKVKNPEFLVFTDEVDWFTSNLDLNINYKIISGKFNLNNAQEMIAMSQCKHNVIANSSFSWWGAWLNKNPDKIVIAPQKWFNYSKINTKDLIPNEWILI